MARPHDRKTEGRPPLPVAERDRRLTEQRRAFYEHRAASSPHRTSAKRYYDERLVRVVHFNIPRGCRVLEIGCGRGDLLASLSPRLGVGIDFSREAIRLARRRHPGLYFVVGDATALPVRTTFDAVVFSNLVGDLVDIQRALDELPRMCHPRTRIFFSHWNYIWEPLVRVAERLGLKPPQPEQNWISPEDLQNLLKLAGLDTVKIGRDFLAPLPIPHLSNAVNDFVATLPGFNRLCVNEFVVGRPGGSARRQEYTVSVVVACKDEHGNIEEIVRTVPRMGLGTELIFVDGHSTDGTVEEIERCIEALPQLNPDLDSVRVMVQPGTGKGEAVRMGFDAARGEVLMILDADITVRSEELPKFYSALADGQGEFINGTRLVYPQEKEAMRFLNLLANHFFGLTFSWLLDQRLTDTLCGTKVLFKRDYERIRQGRSFFGDFDPFGDFDLLFGAAKLNLKICEIPIRYRAREYGEIKISRFRHGWLLLKMAALAFVKFKAFQSSG